MRCAASSSRRRSDDSISSDGSDEENDDEGEEGKESTVEKKKKKKKNQRMFIPDEFVEEDVNVLSAHLTKAERQRLQAIEKTALNLKRSWAKQKMKSSKDRDCSVNPRK